ncbi:Hypp3009 [Branchiostoma lanceolatum]|uniref:Hypp3009 protein n=1 Tax=Branchiostoma lanceolatum TaxID=7740 RepID=A0A8J9ZW86_BRALA|nr:Hypp3009 [Branchiostoma lanceolatum]
MNPAASVYPPGYRGCEPRLLELLVCTRRGTGAVNPGYWRYKAGLLQTLTPNHTHPAASVYPPGYRGCEPRLLEVVQDLRQTMYGLQGDRDELEVVPMQQLLGDGRFQHFLKTANEAVYTGA